MNDYYLPASAHATTTFEDGTLCKSRGKNKSQVFHDTSVVKNLRKKHKIEDPRSTPNRPTGNMKVDQLN